MLSDFLIYQIADFFQERGYLELAIEFQKELLGSSRPQHWEYQKLVKDVTEEVLSRISIKFENDNVIKEIDALNEAIEQLGR